MTYSELLQDERWKLKRIEILKRDNFTCQECGRKECELHVHHHFYYSDTMPWDYDDEILITLCPPCHETEEANKNFDQLSFRYMLTLGLTRSDIIKLFSAISRRINVEGVHSKSIFQIILTQIKNG